MKIKTNHLPNDVESLQTMVTVLQEKLQALNHEKNLEIEKLRHQLQMATMRRYGSSSEKAAPGQLSLFDESTLPQEDEQKSIEAIEETITVPEHQRKKRIVRSFPKNLPRECVVHDLPGEEQICTCGHELHKIGEEKSEKLEVVPAQFKIIEHIRYKYACRNCENGVKICGLPPQPIPKSIATAGLLSYIVVSKFCDHLPLYRQEKIFQRMGVDILDKTLSVWVMKVADLLKPLVNELKKMIVSHNYVQADETPVQVLKQDKEHPSQGYMWVYRGGPAEKIALVYDYQPNRRGENAEVFLREFKGKLQTDAFSGYKLFDAVKHVITAACWAHVRRKYMDIVKTSKTQGKAHQAVSDIQKLYAIEKEARDHSMTFEQRQALRQLKAKPILNNIKIWLDRSIEQVPTKSPIGGAIAYHLKLWPKLTVYLDHGDIEIDTNLVENAIRPFALGRRNWLFCGNHDGAEAAAVIYSLMMTCKANQIEPYAYFKYILDQLPSWPNDNLAALLPQNVDCDQLSKAYHQYSWRS